MDRRDFLKLSGALGVGVSVPWAMVSEARASSYDGPLYMFFNAYGGWDTTMLCDPKGNALNRTYGPDDIEQIGQIRYAPDQLFDLSDSTKKVGYNRTFFERYGSELLIINGLDMTSPNHAIGQRYMWTGRSNSKVYPAFGALVAAQASKETPMAWMSFGEYDVTGGLVPLSRVQSKEQLLDIINPGVIMADESRSYHSGRARSRIQDAVRARHERRLMHTTLPREKEARAQLMTAHLGAQQLSAMRAELPEDMPAEVGKRGFRQSATLAIAAMKAGLCVAANFSLPEFDTHDRNDRAQETSLSLLLQDVDFILRAAEDAGLRDRLTIVLGSDFGRTPEYNAADGKDHWSIGSAMLLGPGIEGNRVLGATNDDLTAMELDPVTLKPVENDQGTRLFPEHIHLALRRKAGIEESEGAKLYPLEVEHPLELF